MLGEPINRDSKRSDAQTGTARLRSTSAACARTADASACSKRSVTCRTRRDIQR